MLFLWSVRMVSCGYNKGECILFNHNLNVLGNEKHAYLEKLSLETFDVDEILLE